jgi:predicted AlkP superfamily phosphohydrolase/phosphomutase
MQPTVLVALDGATFTVLDPLLADGHMPFFKKFLAEGFRAELLSTPHPLTPPAFTTMMTGRSPGQHGIYDFIRADIRADRAFFTLNNFRDIQCETLWTLVSRWGGRVLSLNFPLLAPPPSVAGAIVPGMVSWRHMRRNVHPPQLYDDLKSLPGFDAREFAAEAEAVTAALNMSEEELVPWVRRQVIAREQHWFNILRHLMQTSPCDLTAIIFDSVDKLQHVCWRFLDPAFMPAQPNALERTLRGLCLEYFRQLDGCLEQIVHLAGPGANIFLASDHGFGPTLKSFRVNKWLEQQGYLRWPAPSAAEERLRKNSHFVHLDWANTLVFAPSAPTNGLHIRVRGQSGEPGIPASDYPAFRARLIEKLRALRDPFTGAPYLKDVLTREQAFPGAHMARAPDLTLVPFDHGFVSVLNLEPVLVERPSVWGTHYPVGILMGRGPALRKGQTLDRQAILDIAPTLLYSLGVPIPEDFDGRVMESLFDPAYRQNHPVQAGPATVSPSPFAGTPAAPREDAAEEEIVLNRLRDLGYVE